MAALLDELRVAKSCRDAIALDEKILALDPGNVPATVAVTDVCSRERRR